MSHHTDKDVAFIQALAEILHSSDLAEIDVKREYGEKDELKVRLSRYVAAPAPVVQAAPLPAAAPAVAPAQAATAEDAAQAAGPDYSKAVTSPMVGTAYLAPEPGADNFVAEGDAVEEGDTILIIEAMKTMNHIPAPRSGRVRAVLIENAEPVEFGEPLMIIE